MNGSNITSEKGTQYLSLEEGQTLLRLARRAIVNYLKNRVVIETPQTTAPEGRSIEGTQKEAFLREAFGQDEDKTERSAETESENLEAGKAKQACQLIRKDLFSGLQSISHPKSPPFYQFSINRNMKEEMNELQQIL